VNARRTTFRFGLTGRRWGDRGPVVLLVHGGQTAPRSFAQLIEPLVASGRQVIALDDPTTESSDEAARTREFAYAIAEAAVEIRELESVLGHGLGADAAALAIKQGLSAERVVLLAPDKAPGDDILDFLTGRDALRLAA